VSAGLGIGGIDDVDKFGLERRPSDEETVDVGLAGQETVDVGLAGQLC